MAQISIKTNDPKKQTVIVDFLPTTCPHCHNGIRPNTIIGYIDPENNTYDESYQLHIFMNCPIDNCRDSFIGYYKFKNNTSIGYTFEFLNKISKGTIITKQFQQLITDISPQFSKIYNQSFIAEQEELLEICGVGYRKALEYLIKDYSILNFPDQKEHIKKKMLAQCIGDHINDDRIKSVAKRAVWLGNDETHYIKKWEGKTLKDLKALIDLTVHWIEMESLSKSFEEDMPG
ncbi:MAG: hypothetical protein MUF45_13095 [Spirosomaceae bacterium]|nr:hypothetical protein [Spirosomataceae bacterium]